MKIGIMRFIDGKAGPFICDLLALLKKAFRERPRTLPKPDEVRNILVIKLWGFGSIILSTPMLQALKKEFPRARITIVTFAENSGICRMLSCIDDVHLIPIGSAGAFALSAFRLVQRLRKTRFDIGINLEFFSTFAALLCSLLSIRFRMGFGGYSWTRRVLFDYLVSYESGVHISEKFMNFARVFSDVPEGLPLERISPPPEAVESAMRRLGPAITEGKSLILLVLNINSSSMAPKRKWPLTHFKEAAEWLLRQPDVVVLVIGSKRDRPYIEGFLSLLPRSERIIDLSGELSLTELAAVLDRADIYFGNDSGPLHLAVSVGTPSLSIFGPETPLVYGPRDAGDHRVLFLGIPCSPCLNIYSNKGAYCNDHVCVSKIAPDLAIKNLGEMIKAAREKRKSTTRA